MPTPTERLEQRRQLSECRLCAWLQTLEAKDRREWSTAIANPRFSHEMVATEIRLEQEAQNYTGEIVGSSTVRTHRKKHH